MQIKKTAWKYFKPNETMCVILGVFFFLAFLTLLSLYRRDAPFNSEINYENLSPAQKKRADQITALIPTGEDDKNVRYAERIREASSIGLGISLFLINRRVANNRVLTLAEAMAEFAQSDLLPPGVIVLFPAPPKSYGLLRTKSGFYFLNYSPKPLRVEILAGSINGLLDGAVFVLRIPDTAAANMKPAVDSAKVSSAGAWATIFEAPDNENHYIPPPFAPAQTYVAMDWQIRPLQQAEMSPQRLQELNDYLRRQQ